MEIKDKIWIEKNSKVFFGKGRDDIIKAINEQHSLNAASQKLEKDVEQLSHAPIQNFEKMIRKRGKEIHDNSF